MLKVPKVTDLIKMRVVYCVYITQSLPFDISKKLTAQVEKIGEIVGGEELELKSPTSMTQWLSIYL